jgi:hypothetical protein
MTIKRSDVVRAVVVRTKHVVLRENGMFIRFDENAAVIVNQDGNPIGTLCFFFIKLLKFLLILFKFYFVEFLDLLLVNYEKKIF